MAIRVMLKFPSHYETLKVRHDASPKAIRTAYKQLARQFHPDRNGNSAESHGRMQALNAAFEVLSDDQRRADYDEWLLRFGKAPSIPVWHWKNIEAWLRSRRRELTHLAHTIKPVREITAARWAARIGFVALVLWGLNLDREPTLHADITPPFESQTPVPAPLPVSGFHRPLRAPNGTEWPVTAAEIEGYPVERNDGKSVVTVDNSRNHMDVFAKLVSIDGSSVKPVRHIYIPARSAFSCRNVTKGLYEVRYQDLGSGLTARSGEFEVIETRTDRTVNSSVMKITLARITDTRPAGLLISEHEF
jgi:hypothetical protein